MLELNWAVILWNWGIVFGFLAAIYLVRKANRMS